MPVQVIVVIVISWYRLCRTMCTLVMHSESSSKGAGEARAPGDRPAGEPRAPTDRPSNVFIYHPVTTTVVYQHNNITKKRRKYAKKRRPSSQQPPTFNNTAYNISMNFYGQSGTSVRDGEGEVQRDRPEKDVNPPNNQSEMPVPTRAPYTADSFPSPDLVQYDSQRGVAHMQSRQDTAAHSYNQYSDFTASASSYAPLAPPHCAQAHPGHNASQYYVPSHYGASAATRDLGNPRALMKGNDEYAPNGRAAVGDRHRVRHVPDRPYRPPSSSATCTNPTNDCVTVGGPSAHVEHAMRCSAQLHAQGDAFAGTSHGRGLETVTTDATRFSSYNAADISGSYYGAGDTADSLTDYGYPQ